MTEYQVGQYGLRVYQLMTAAEMQAIVNAVLDALNTNDPTWWGHAPTGTPCPECQHPKEGEQQ